MSQVKQWIYDLKILPNDKRGLHQALAVQEL